MPKALLDEVDLSLDGNHLGLDLGQHTLTKIFLQFLNYLFKPLLASRDPINKSQVLCQKTLNLLSIMPEFLNISLNPINFDIEANQFANRP